MAPGSYPNNLVMGGALGINLILLVIVVKAINREGNRKT